METKFNGKKVKCTGFRKIKMNENTMEPYQQHIKSNKSILLPDIKPKIGNMVIIPVIEKCENCNGTGYHLDGKYHEDCMKCGGSGIIYL